jgi:uncharacterized protein (DUF302 family)
MTNRTMSRLSMLSLIEKKICQPSVQPQFTEEGTFREHYKRLKSSLNKSGVVIFRNCAHHTNYI